MPILNSRTLNALKPGDWKTDGGTRGGGTLVARKLGGGGVLFYFRYTNSKQKRETIALGEWSGTNGPLSLDTARARANELSARYRAGEIDLHQAMAADAQALRDARDAAAKESAADEARKRATLAALLDAYVIDLRSRGKLSSARDTAAAVKRHVLEPWPKLASKPADEISLSDLLSIIRRVAKAGKLNEARKLRSYLRAAYAAAISAQQDATACQELQELGIAKNPARDLATVKGAVSAGTRALSRSELRAYWSRINVKGDPTKAALRFLLLTGAQRQAQLGRVKVEQHDPDNHTVTLYDGKGRRVHAAAHLVPLIGAAERAISEMAPIRLGDYVFTLTLGKSGVASGELSRRLKGVVAEMESAGELENGPFTLADLRRTVETQLASLRVSKDVRAQLQSHGRGGVQSRHYDRHDYLDEKREALDKLYQLLTARPAEVLPLRRRMETASG